VKSDASADSQAIRVLLVDDHSFVRAAVSALLSDEDGIEVVGECADGVDVASTAASVRPDVVLMDVRMPTSGIEATRSLLAEQPTVRVLMLTSSFQADEFEKAARAGAVGFLAKGGQPAVLVSAIRIAAAGGTVWPDQPH